MADDSFYIRMRGKTSGPFGVESLRRMVRTGALSRIHEISADRATWSRASEYVELFPARPVAAPQPPPEIATDSTVATAQATDAPAPIAIAPPPLADLLYYSKNGLAVGPVSMAVLKLLAQNGSIAPDDMVWHENAESAVPARQLPALAAHYSTVDVPYQGTSRHRRGVEPSKTLKFAALRAANSARVGGIVAGALILICLLLPWFVTNDRALWTWDLYSIPDAGVWATLSTYLILCGIALCIVGPITSGVSRGACYVALAGFAVLFIVVAGLGSGGRADASLEMLVPAALAGMIGACSARSAVPSSSAARAVMGVCAGILALGALTALIQFASIHTEFSDAPPEVVLAIVLIFIGMILAVAASITGFIGLGTVFLPGLNLTTRILSLTALIFPLAGIVVLAIAFASAGDGETLLAIQIRSHFGQALFRVMLVWLSLLEVIGLGIYELIVAAALKQQSPIA